MRYFGRTEEDFPSAIVADEVATLEDHLETFLSANWPDWITTCNSVVAAGGINLAKNQLEYRTATLEIERDVPEVLVQILAKVEGE